VTKRHSRAAQSPEDENAPDLVPYSGTWVWARKSRFQYRFPEGRQRVYPFLETAPHNFGRHQSKNHLTVGVVAV